MQWIGYLASLVIAVSMMMSSVVKFRWINLVGALLFSVYGFLIGAVPVGILNGIIVIVNVYYLTKIYSKKELFEVLEIDAESEYLIRFLNFNNSRIRKICPEFSYHPTKNIVSFFILRNMSVTGLFIASRENGDILNVLLDYVLPEYKDFKNGKFVYNNLRQRFIDLGFKTVVAEGNNPQYVKYLKKLGFTEDKDGFYLMVL